jgi:hypothetical protein
MGPENSSIEKFMLSILIFLPLDKCIAIMAIFLHDEMSLFLDLLAINLLDKTPPNTVGMAWLLSYASKFRLHQKLTFSAQRVWTCSEIS